MECQNLLKAGDLFGVRGQGLGPFIVAPGESALTAEPDAAQTGPGEGFFRRPQKAGAVREAFLGGGQALFGKVVGKVGGVKGFAGVLVLGRRQGRGPEGAGVGSEAGLEGPEGGERGGRVGQKASAGLAVETFDGDWISPTGSEAAFLRKPFGTVGMGEGRSDLEGGAITAGQEESSTVGHGWMEALV